MHHNSTVQLTHHDFQLPLVRLIRDGSRVCLPHFLHAAAARGESRREMSGLEDICNCQHQTLIREMLASQAAAHQSG